MPGVSQVVSVSVGNHDKSLYGVNVLLLHLCDTWAGSEQCKPGQGLDISISFQLQTETENPPNKWDQEKLTQNEITIEKHQPAY